MLFIYGGRSYEISGNNQQNNTAKLEKQKFIFQIGTLSFCFHAMAAFNVTQMKRKATNRDFICESGWNVARHSLKNTWR